MLRTVVEGDLQILFEHQRDPEATSMAAFPARKWAAFISNWRHKVLGKPATALESSVSDGCMCGESRVIRSATAPSSGSASDPAVPNDRCGFDASPDLRAFPGSIRQFAFTSRASRSGRPKQARTPYASGSAAASPFTV